MANTNTLSRSLHDVGLATWFGGTLANAVALNPAAAEAKDPASTGAVANAVGRRSTRRRSAPTSPARSGSWPATVTD